MERQDDPSGLSAKIGQPPADLIAWIEANADRLSYFQAMRLLENSVPSDHQRPDHMVGGRAASGNEVARIRVAQGSHFPESEIATAKYDKETRRLDMFVQFMGLTGPSGVLPLHYSEYAFQRDRKGDAALADFLDLLQHRTASFFYRAWKKYRLDINAEADGIRGQDPITRLISSFIGMHGKAMRGRLEISDVALFGYSGNLTRRANAQTLAWLIEDAIGEEVEVESFKGGWIVIPPADRTRLGSERTGAWNQLGTNAVLGTEYWDIQRRFQIKIGNVSWTRLLEFFPGQKLRKRVTELAKFAAGPGLEFDLRIGVYSADIPALTLGDKNARLGWSAWLPSDGAREKVRYARLSVSE